jgi:hypothetical protein
MPLRKLKFKLLSSLLIVVAVAGLAGAAVLAQAPYHSIATTIHPSATVGATIAPSPTAISETPVPTSHPAVAGVATQAPANYPQAVSTATPVPTATPCLTPAGAIVGLTLKYGGKTFSCNVSFRDGADACTILRQAQVEGKITSLTIYDSPDYIASHGNSAYLYELNGYKDNWTYSAQASSGKPIPAPGCSLTPVHAGDSVTWKFGG